LHFGPDDVLEHTFSTGDYIDEEGGGSEKLYAFRLTATDCSGNATTKRIRVSPFVYQEDGSTPNGPPGVTITYSGVWGQSNCACHLADHTALTTRRGASVSITRTFERGDQVAVVMAKGPGRGVASIRLDGRWLRNVDTFATVNTNRVVVFEMEMSSGTHTLTILNQATTGRPRIDFDAVMMGIG
jgi:hypothetical protein